MITVSVGDITKLGGTQFASAAIVNAANRPLQQGGGVCGAIFLAAGPEQLQQACNDIAPCPTGEARLTPSFALQSQGVSAIIHAVGPIFGDTSPAEADAFLRSAYLSSVACAKDAGLSSIAFPAISTGIYGFPEERAAVLSIRALQEIDQVDFTINLIAFNEESADLWRSALEE